MLIGQDLGLTLDLETWNIRASARGIRQRTDLVVTGARPAGTNAGAGALVLDLLHHPTGSTTQLSCDWVACAVPPQPADELWHALAGAPFERHRVGDCRAPRRAHAAVIEGDRAGAAL
jgi:2,4-dienoyl-CoA reductase (NADPH2)